MSVMPTDEIRNFAGVLPHVDLAHASGGLPVTLSGFMDEIKSPNEFIAAWAPKMVGFGNDFSRGIEAFRTIAQQAADRFEATDADYKTILGELVNSARTDQTSAQSEGLGSLPHTRPFTGPLTPPKELTPVTVNRPGHHSYGGYNSGFDFDN